MELRIFCKHNDKFDTDRYILTFSNPESYPLWSNQTNNSKSSHFVYSTFNSYEFCDSLDTHLYTFCLNHMSPKQSTWFLCWNFIHTQCLGYTFDSADWQKTWKKHFSTWKNNNHFIHSWWWSPVIRRSTAAYVLTEFALCTTDSHHNKDNRKVQRHTLSLIWMHG